MKQSTFVLFCFFGFLLLWMNFYCVFAKPPATAKIIFNTHRDGNREIFLMNPDGSEQVNMTNHRADDVSGTWSPTGEQILFASDRDRFPGSWDLYLMDAVEKNVRPVFEKSVDRRHPTWSPDGKQIAYRRVDAGVGYIYIATSDGRNEERIAIGGSPAWSPDGREIAFVVRVAPTRLNIYILDMRTRTQKVFFPLDAISTAREPVWTSAGNALAFMWHQKRPEDEGEIYMMDRDGTRLQELVNEPGVGAATPVWSPSGDELLYRGRLKQREQTHIFKIVLGDGPPVQLTAIGLWNVPSDWFDPAYALPVSPQPRFIS